MERQFILTEAQLRDLLIAALENEMLGRDGVDSWGWHGESFCEVVRDNYPKNLSFDEIREQNISFEDCAQAMIDTGAYLELVHFDT